MESPFLYCHDDHFNSKSPFCRHNIRYRKTSPAVPTGGATCKEIKMASPKHIGYAFLLEDSSGENVFTPEDLSPEQLEFMRVTREFVSKDFEPVRHDLEKLDRDLLRATLQKAGEAGLFMIQIPEEYGGMGLDLLSQMVVIESIAPTGGFSVAYGVQTGIGSEPILFFGTDDQKQRYLPRLATGEMIGAYGLTEPGSGSDALAARSTAVLSSDQTHYVLNGSKIFISNGGIADLFIIFAKVDGQHFTAFLVERDTPGFQVGGEEAKLGIKSSSTTALTFQDMKVPRENLLGEIGKGHKIALNILNVGRLKLGMGVVGGMKDALGRSVRYALQRKQFGKALVEFPLIQQKLAQIAACTYASESVAYRTAGSINQIIEDRSESESASLDKTLATLEEFSGECAINKVFDSECLAVAADEAVQIHGGYGFCEEYRVEATYRDARIARIYEGTNEINRLFIAGNLLKRTQTGRLALLQAIQQAQKAVLERLPDPPADSSPLGDILTAIPNAKRIFHLLVGLVSQKFLPNMEKIADEQEIMAAFADLIIQIYVLESITLRAVKRIRQGDPRSGLHQTVVRYQAIECFEKIDQLANRLIDSVFRDDARLTHRAIVRKWSHWPHLNRVELGRALARECIAAEGYPFVVQ